MIWPTLIILTLIVYSLYAAHQANKYRDEYDEIGLFCLRFWRKLGMFR